MGFFDRMFDDFEFDFRLLLMLVLGFTLGWFVAMLSIYGV